MIHTILFDLDETLYPPEAGVMRQIGERITLYVQARLSLATDEALAVRRRYFQEYGTTMRGLQINYGIDPDEYLAYVHQIPLEQYLHPNERLDKVLQNIPQEKIIFTNASREHAERVLALLGIRRHFSRIVDIRDVGYESKPQPDAYERICRILGVRAEECLIVEDNLRNLLPAKALGMTTVLVRNGHTEPEDGVDWVIEQIEEIGTVVGQAF